MSSRYGVLLVLLGAAMGSSALAAEKPSLLVVPAAPQDTRLQSATIATLAHSDRYRVLLISALLPLMRQADEQASLRRRATALVEEGRRLLVGLDHAGAKAKLDAALELLEGGFARYYDPAAVAQVRLLLGMWALDGARPDLAQREFAEAHQLDPGLTLGPHYSPQVRAAFGAARQAATTTSPSAGELKKLLRLARSPAAAVVAVEPAGERTLIRGAVFAAAKSSYVGVESALIETANPEALSRGTAALGEQLRRLAEPLFPAPPPRLFVRQPVEKPIPSTPLPRKKPWYRRWYTWVSAGVVVAGTVAIVLPLTIKREVVESTIRW